MTYGEAKTLVKQFLLGDNSNAEVTELIATQALYEVASVCEPVSLITSYYKGDNKPDDIFRIIEEITDDKGKTIVRYIRKPKVKEDTDEVDLDIDLHTAFVFYCCSYLSYKQKDYFEAKANNIVSIYKSNHSFESGATF
jgi:hypothetical protein